jgi:hypothetical protein
MIAIIALAAAAVLPARSALESETKIVGFEYAFTAPSELPAGRRAFTFENRGKVPHELNITLLKPGATIQQFITAANAGKPLSPFIDAPVGVLFAAPGKTSPSALATELRAGRTYAIICIFRDSAGKPKHHALGMFSAIHVSAVPAPRVKALPVDTIFAMDYAFRAPQTLTAGTHYFALVNTGKQRHEVAVALLRKGVTLQKIVEVDKVDGDVEPYFEHDFGLLHAQPGTTPAGLLRIELLPGRTYLLECGFSDTDKSPPHYKLGMYGTINVP